MPIEISRQRSVHMVEASLWPSVWMFMEKIDSFRFLKIKQASFNTSLELLCDVCVSSLVTLNK